MLVAHGVTKTTPNATHRVAPHAVPALTELKVRFYAVFTLFCAAIGPYPATFDQQRTH